jgi:hypothetical protein
MTLIDGLGPRATRRAEPRLGVVLAGAGMVLTIIGVLSWSGDELGEGTGGSDKGLGIVLSLAVVAAGYALQALYRRGPLAAAGTVAATLGVPSLLFFLTFDADKALEGEPPFSLDAVLLVSAVIWLVSYAIGPGRGRPFPLGTALVVLWLYVVEKSEGVIALPFTLFGDLVAGGLGEDLGRSQPDVTNIGALSMLFAAGYYVASLLLDRTGRHGIATPVLAAGVLPLVVGIATLSDDLDTAGVGIVSVILGFIVASIGTAGIGRRFTSWFGGAGVVFGVLLLIDEAVGDSSRNAGIVAIIVGVGVVILAQALSMATNEPDEMVIDADVVAVAPVARATSVTDADVADEVQWRPPQSPPPPAPPPPPPPAP